MIIEAEQQYVILQPTVHHSTDFQLIKTRRTLPMIIEAELQYVILQPTVDSGLGSFPIALALGFERVSL